MEAQIHSLSPQLDAIHWNPAAGLAAVDSLCVAAADAKLRAVCLNTSRIAQAAAKLEETSVKAVALVGFPFGAMDADAKRYEAELAFDLGAHEVEVVLGMGQIKDGDGGRLLRELRDIVEAADERPVGAVIELAKLSDDELKFVAEVICDAGVQRICTSTDFWPDSRVTTDDVKRLRETAGEKIQIKAVGGVRGEAEARALLDAGAGLIGSIGFAVLIRPPKA